MDTPSCAWHSTSAASMNRCRYKKACIAAGLLCREPNSSHGRHQSERWQPMLQAQALIPDQGQFADVTV